MSMTSRSRWASLRILAAILLGVVGRAHGDLEGEGGGGRIKGVVTKLQEMQKQVEADFKRERDLYDKYMCSSKDLSGKLTKSLSDAEAKMPQVEAKIGELTALKATLENDLINAKKNFDKIQASATEAKNLRTTQAKEFKATVNDLSKNIEALKKAIASLKKGTAGQFIQTNEAATVQMIVASAELSSGDRDALSSFLSGESQTDSDADSAAAPSSEIQGMLAQMLDDMVKDKAEAITAENNAKTQYAGLAKTSGQQAAAVKTEISVKTKRLGETGVALQTNKEDLSDTKTTYDKEKVLLTEVQEAMRQKELYWLGIQKTVDEETKALNEAIKILTTEFMRTFKTKGKSASFFLQLNARRSSAKHKATLRALRDLFGSRSHHKDAQMSFLVQYLDTRAFNFGNLKKMVDEVIDTLHLEQKQEKLKYDTCNKEIANLKTAIEGAHQSIQETTAANNEKKSKMKTLLAEIKSLGAEIKVLDEQVKKAGTQRQAENAVFKKTLADAYLARDAVNKATLILTRFYASKQAKKDAISSSVSFVSTPSFMEIAAHRHRKPKKKTVHKKPKAQFSYKKNAGGAKVLGLLKEVLKEIDADAQAAKSAEKNAQATYEDFIKKAQATTLAKRSKIADQEAAKADAEAELQQGHKKLEATQAKLTSKKEEKKLQHKNCDWLIKNYNIRTKARAAEIEAMNVAKGILAGAGSAAPTAKKSKFMLDQQGEEGDESALPQPDQQDEESEVPSFLQLDHQRLRR